MTNSQQHNAGVGLAIHRLTLDDFAGVPHVDLDLADSGVTVVHGRNESGKSTLLTAMKLLLNTGVNTKTRKQEVMALKPVGSNGKPTVAAEMSIEAYRLRIEKSFGTGRHAATLDVSAPTVENLVDREAEERFAEILNETVDRTLLDALTVEQGASLEAFSAGRIQSLSTVLAAQSDQSAEAVTGHEVDATAAELLAAIEKEYDRYFTAKGAVKKNGELQKARDEREAAEQALAEATDIYDGAQRQIRAITELEEEERQAAVELPEAKRAVEELEEQLQTARAAQEKLRSFEREVKNAHQALDLAKYRHDARKKQVDAVAVKRAELEKEQERRDELATKAAKAEEEQQKLKAEYSSAAEQQRFARGYVAWAQAGAEYRETEKSHKNATERAAEAEKTVGRLRELENKLAENPATQQALDALSSANTQLAVATAQQEAIATEVKITGPAGTVRDGEEDVELTAEGYRTLVSSPRQFALGDYRVAVTPARDTSETETAVSCAREQVAQASKALGIEDGDTEAAHRLAQQRRVLENDRDEAQLELRGITGGVSSQDLQFSVEQSSRELVAAGEKLSDRARAAANIWRELGGNAERAEEFGLEPELEEQLARLTRDSSREATEDTEPQVAEARTAGEQAPGHNGELAGLVVDLETAQLFLERSEARYTAAQQAKDATEHSQILQEHKLAELNATQQTQQLAAAEDELAQQREEASDEQLAEAVAVQNSALVEAAAIRDKEKEKYESAATAEQLEGLLNGEKAGLGVLQKNATQRGQELVRLRTELAGREGAAEAKREAAAEAERAARALAAVTARAEAAQLLWETMNEARAELRGRYSRPLSEAFHVLARTIYGPGVQFEFDEDLQVSRRIDDGLALDVSSLSGGAREQINLLSRLAVASLVARGGGVPIIIDDSLGYSDPQRSRDMNVVLSQLGEQHQIIVLTCDAQRFSRVVGAKQVDMVQLRRGGE